ncbi:hypothetical protein ACOCJ7_07045 [Knoellia sp. CPCC 206453]
MPRADLQWHRYEALPAPIPVYERVVIDSLSGGPLAPTTTHGFR